MVQVAFEDNYQILFILNKYMTVHLLQKSRFAINWRNNIKKQKLWPLNDDLVIFSEFYISFPHP